MCGIAGKVYADAARGPAPEVVGAVDAMRDVQAHRGPDDCGTWTGPGCTLASRRLAVIDLSPRGRMPMSTPDGRFHIVHNGEVYNYRELRAGLTARGHTFQTETDTEVVLRLFAEEGPACLPRMNGMFAFAVWDARERELFLARDRLGVKPLHYALTADGLSFSSEIKGLFAGGVEPEFDETCWEELLVFRFVAGERTPFRGVRRLRPGHWLRWRDARVETHRWWDLGEKALEPPPQDPQDAQDAAAWFARTFDASVALRRISDVPVGVLLSGGLDSGSVAASIAQGGASGLSSFTVRFAEPAYDEGREARALASRWGLSHHEVVVPEDALPQRLARATWLMDEPLAHASDPHLLAVSEHAKSKVTVLLCGEGADETLGGYRRYGPLRRRRSMRALRGLLAAGAGLPGRLGRLGRFASLGSVERMVLYDACETYPADLVAVGMQPTGEFAFREEVLAEARALFPKEPVRQAMHLDQRTFLESLLARNDRMTMGASIECRVPFLDHRLVEALAGLPSRVLLCGRKNKPLLRRALSSRLPRSVRRAPKRGFPVPWHLYLRRQSELRARVSALADSPCVRSGPFSASRVRSVCDEFLRGRNRHASLVRQLLFISLWHEVVLESRQNGRTQRAPTASPAVRSP